MATPETDPTIYRLTDIETKEVSVVDRAANKRCFLIVKGASMTTKKGDPVVGDGKGGHTVTKETPAPGSAPTTPAKPETGTGGPTNEPVLALSPEAKASLIKRFEMAATRIAAIKALVAGATEQPGLVEVPAEIVTKVAELLFGIERGEVEKDANGQPIAKGLPQFSGARVSQLTAARDAINVLLESIAKPVAPAVDPEPAPTEVDVDDVVTKALAKALVPFETKLASGLEKIANVVAKHGEALGAQATQVAEIAKARQTPNAGVDDGRTDTNKGGDVDFEDEDNSPGWSHDMTQPDKYDVKKADPSVRFTKK
jgi:hypothetical protein